MVPEALNESSAVVVTGGDLGGEEAALDYLARRAPSLWDTARGAPTLGDARHAVKRLLDGRTTAAQAALVVAELDEMVEDLDDLDLDTVTVDVYLKDRSEPFEDWLSAALSERLDVEDIPDESEQIAHTLGTLPTVTTYVAGESYQGRPVSVMEITLPMEAECGRRGVTRPGGTGDQSAHL